MLTGSNPGVQFSMFILLYCLYNHRTCLLVALSPNSEVFSAESLWARLKYKNDQKVDPMLLVGSESAFDNGGIFYCMVES
jgi:hypothetical protein